jgi:outer membrane receptor protein involved in Fe transport
MKETRRNGLFRLVAAVTAAGAIATFLPTANAQQEGAAELEEIVVTGSRIKRDTFNYSTPVSVIDSAEISATGSTNLGDLLQTMPQTISSINNANTAFSTTFNGLNLTDLRYLGPDRTLVLVNGRRFVSGTPPGGGYGVDLNAIPTAMIERIEVLTGGASAIYGSDALAGVVNVITKSDFEGIEVELQTGAATEGDMEKNDAAVTIGGEFGAGGNAILSVGYSDHEPLRSRQRSFSDTDLAYYDIDDDGLGETAEWLGSSFPPQGVIGGYNGDGTPFRSGLADRENSDRFNRASYRSIFAPVERRFATAIANYPLSDRVEAFTEINWSSVKTDGEIEPYPASINDDVFLFSRGGNDGLDVASNLLMPQALRDALLADGITNTNQVGTNGWVRRLVEFGPRQSDVDRTTTRYVVGLDFDLTDDWTIETYYTYGRTEQNQTDLNRYNTERARYALDVELAPDGVTLQCVDELARLQGCVPFNTFGAGAISDDAVQYLRANQNLKTKVEQQVFNIGIAGNTGFELPGGAIGLAGGFEWREERGSEINGGFAQTGIGSGNATAPTNGKWDVSEIYAEASFPVLDRLTLDGAVRAADYSTVGSQTTWKVGLDLEILETLRFRASATESVRAPNVSDLYAGAGETFANVQDPCDSITNATTGVVAENCRSIPAIQDRIDTTGSFTLTQSELQQTGGFVGGNPEVNEETAESFTAGLIWTPTFLDNALSVAVDYYDIRIDDAIAITSRNTVVERCYNVDPAVFDPTCGNGTIPGTPRVLRDSRDVIPGQGSLLSVDSVSSNENIFDTSGLDIEVAYIQELGPGTLSASMVWNYLLKWDEIGIFDGDLDDNLGEVLTPEHRAILRTSYFLGDWTFFWRARYWDAVKDSNTPELQNENSCVCADGLAPSANEISAYVYHDFSVGYGRDQWSVKLGLNNAFDKEPPMLPQITQYGNTGTNTAVEAYDTIGAQWFLSFNYRTN